MPRGTATRRATECALSGARFAPDLLFEFFRASFLLLRRFLKVSANLFLLGFRTKMPDRARPGGGGDVDRIFPEFLLEFWAGLGNGKYGDFPAITLVIIWLND